MGLFILARIIPTMPDSEWESAWQQTCKILRNYPVPLMALKWTETTYGRPTAREGEQPRGAAVDMGEKLRNLMANSDCDNFFGGGTAETYLCAMTRLSTERGPRIFPRSPSRSWW